jgi:hypothetical protein
MPVREGLLFILLAFAAASPTADGEAKAYDLVKYRGQAGLLTIAFDFADGYSEASQIRVTDSATKKTTRFKLADNGDQRFVPAKAKPGRSEEIILNIDLEDAAPERINGTYRVEGKKIPFRLERT